MDKEDVLYMYMMEYYSSIKKNKNLPFATTWMDIEKIMLSERSQKKVNTKCEITYMRNLKNKTNEQNGTKQK